MQDDRRPGPPPAGHPSAGPYGSQFKVAIPRLPPRRAPPPTTPKSRQRDRVQRACRNCHKRRKTGWRRQLNDLIPSSEIDSASAKDRNHALVSVLKDLSLRVSDDDRRRIEDALQDSDDEVGSPVSISSSSRASAPQPFSQHSRMHPFAPSSSYVPLGAETSPTSDQSPLPRLDGTVPEDSGDEDGGELPNVVEAGFLGQISEVQWLQTLRSRVQALDTVLLGPPDTTAPLSQPPSPTFTASPTSHAATPLEHIALTNYYLDDEGIKLTDCGNPFELPPEHTAGLLFQCFTQTIQGSFPILPPTIEHQLQQYYTLVRNGQAIHCPEKWFALVNLVFAIGAKFSHLIQAEWRADELDHIAAGLFAIYYMTAGHVNRAWVMVGMAMRSAFSLGLHVQQDDQSVSAARRQSMVCTWWSLHALESMLSSITGRPSIIPNEDITTPLPSAVNSDQTQSVPVSNLDFLDADIHLNLLTQQIISNLYTQRRSAPSWDYVQQMTISLCEHLDKWAFEYIPQVHSEDRNPARMQQRDIFLLKLQYYRLKVLTTRPSLRRIERCFQAGTDDFNSLDQSVAESCVQAARDVASLLANEPNVRSLYEKGPWWTIVHNIMQSLAVLMIAISCPDHFRDTLQASVHSTRQLVTSLRSMCDTNMLASRAYQVVYSIVKTSKPYVWADIADAFPDEVIMVLQQPAPAKVDPQYLPWPDNDQPAEALFRYEMDNFGNYHFHML
ncbi:uncharacterized protein J4E79_010397 [Alternaria viburni]|uniref:uncharacterized protein n=1 Tax=Alternaria viburni TaxID=566460 RepID=UPI0020C52A0C|nr:uncharacterized protein J4E79_010397 [Alternaria viburni]KAI4647246.1 hypothetical protein J4E79_010397 [Alternaria viburni]